MVNQHNTVSIYEERPENKKMYYQMFDDAILATFILTNNTDAVNIKEL